MAKDSGYIRRSYTAYGGTEPYDGEGFSRHVGHPVMTGEEGRKLPDSFRSSVHNGGRLVVKREVIVEHVRGTPVVTGYVYGSSANKEPSGDYVMVNNNVQKPVVYVNPDEAAEEFIRKVQVEASRPPNTKPGAGPFGPTYPRGSSGWKGQYDDSAGYDRHGDLSHDRWNNPNDSYTRKHEESQFQNNGLAKRWPPPPRPVDHQPPLGSTYWHTRPSWQGQDGTTKHGGPGDYSNTNNYWDDQHSNSLYNQTGGPNFRRNEKTSTEYEGGGYEEPSRETRFVARGTAPARTDTYTEVIDSREAVRRYNGVPVPEPKRKYNYGETISSKDAVRKYKGILVP